MDKGIYTALSGGIAKSHELDLIANNLANANTAGFKRDTGTFNEYLSELRHPDSVQSLGREIAGLTSQDGRAVGDKSFVEMDGVYTDFRQGGLQKTGRTLDLALEGKGFFEVLTPQGVRYTRAGSFSIDKDGRLVTSNGHPVLSRTPKSGGADAAQSGGAFAVVGAKQPATPKPQAPQTVGAELRTITLGEGPVQVTPEGDIMQNGVLTASINIEEFNEPQWLEKVGNSLYRNTNADNIKGTTAESKMHQGFIEGSNVNAVTEMTRLIEATRSYESHMQAIKTYQDIDMRTANDIAKER